MTRIIEDIKLDFSDVLLLPKRSSLYSRSQISLERNYSYKHSPLKYSGVPIVVANMDHTGTMNMAIALHEYRVGVALHKFYSVQNLITFFRNPISKYSFYAMGITSEEYLKFKEVKKQLGPRSFQLQNICVDVANGYSVKLGEYIERLRYDYPDICIMAGNVVTPDMTYDLLERGADIVKIGIGSGSVCTTRKITGVGYPQLSAVMECSDAAHGAGGLICSDGGIVAPGDVAKAFAGGADFVMSGGLFAGHQQCEGEIVVHENKDPTMRFHGMSSTEAMEAHYGEKATYRAAEGKAVDVPFKGNVVDTINEVFGGLRSACTYTGAQTLKQLPKCASFVRVNRILNNSLSQYEV